MQFDYCPKCGRRLEGRRYGDDDCQFCPSCKKMYGSSPFPVVEVLVVNERNEVLLLKQNYISTEKWTLVTGYVIDGETLEEAALREVKEETGQDVIDLHYVSSYYFSPKQLIMVGFIAYVNQSEFANSQEVDDIKWYRPEEVDAVIARENNCSGMHFDRCRSLLYEIKKKAPQ